MRVTLVRQVPTPHPHLPSAPLPRGPPCGSEAQIVKRVLLKGCMHALRRPGGGGVADEKSRAYAAASVDAGWDTAGLKPLRSKLEQPDCKPTGPAFQSQVT